MCIRNGSSHVGNSYGYVVLNDGIHHYLPEHLLRLETLRTLINNAPPGLSLSGSENGIHVGFYGLLE